MYNLIGVLIFHYFWKMQSDIWGHTKIKIAPNIHPLNNNTRKELFGLWSLPIRRCRMYLVILLSLYRGTSWIEWVVDNPIEREIKKSKRIEQ